MRSSHSPVRRRLGRRNLLSLGKAAVSTRHGTGSNGKSVLFITLWTSCANIALHCCKCRVVFPYSICMGVAKLGGGREGLCVEPPLWLVEEKTWRHKFCQKSLFGMFQILPLEFIWEFLFIFLRHFPNINQGISSIYNVIFQRTLLRATQSSSQVLSKIKVIFLRTLLRK